MCPVMSPAVVICNRIKRNCAVTCPRKMAELMLCCKCGWTRQSECAHYHVKSKQVNLLHAL